MDIEQSRVDIVQSRVDIEQSRVDIEQSRVDIVLSHFDLDVILNSANQNIQQSVHPSSHTFACSVSHLLTHSAPTHLIYRSV